MAEHFVRVVVPTLSAGPHLLECLAGLEAQTLREWEAVVVDNSGAGLARKALAGQAGREDPRIRILDNARNAGFGAAINQGWAGARTPFLAALNDDAVPAPGCLAEMVAALERRPRAGMCAASVRLADGRLDSAGMLISADGSSKQRGHLRTPLEFTQEEEVLLPSGSAALYRRAMVEEVGGFDEAFFLYCEDTDLGLRARRAGWACIYAPRAEVVHAYSQTSGAASHLKAYYVERNRLFVLIKNFPVAMLAAAPLATAARYFWHAVAALRGQGAAGRYRAAGGGAFGLAGIVLRAHAAAAAALPALWKERNRIGARSRLSAAEFGGLLRRHSIGVREVAAL